MFFEDQDLSIHQISMEDLKLQNSQLSTAAHNTSATAKFKFLNEEQSTLNCSFDQGGQSGHAQQVWNASVIYVQSSLRGETHSQEGLNDQSLYDLSHDNSVLNDKTFDQLILGNGNLSIQQKHQFIEMLRKQSELMDLFTELSTLFNLTVFQQVAYLIFKIWQKRHELLQFSLKQDPFQNYILPRFNCFSDLQNEETFSLAPYIPYKEKKSYDQVKKEAQNCSKSLANQMFYDKKLHLLSLRQCKRQCKAEEFIRSQFEKFFTILTTSIYLSIQGFFSESDNEQKMFKNQEMDSEQDFDIRSVCSFDEFMPVCNFYEQDFSESEQKEDEQEEESLSGRKKRKLQ